MGLYIEGVEMPKGNDELRLIIRSNGQVIISHKTYYEEAEAVIVPPHGDLIERNTLDVIGYCGIPQGCEDTFDSGVMWLAERIDELPTIIPAEEG